MNANDFATFLAIQNSSCPMVLSPAEVDAVTTPEMDDLIAFVTSTVAASKYYRASPTWASCEDFTWSTIRKEIGDELTYEHSTGQRVADGVEADLFH